MACFSTTAVSLEELLSEATGATLPCIRFRLIIKHHKMSSIDSAYLFATLRSSISLGSRPGLTPRWSFTPASYHFSIQSGAAHMHTQVGTLRRRSIPLLWRNPFSTRPTWLPCLVSTQWNRKYYHLYFKNMATTYPPCWHTWGDPTIRANLPACKELDK